MLAELLLGLALRPRVEYLPAGYDRQARPAIETALVTLEERYPSLLPSLAAKGFALTIQEEPFLARLPQPWQEERARCERNGRDAAACAATERYIHTSTGIFFEKTKHAYVTPLSHRSSFAGTLLHEIGHAVDVLLGADTYFHYEPELARVEHDADEAPPEIFADWFSCSLIPDQPICERIGPCKPCERMLDDILDGE